MSTPSPGGRARLGPRLLSGPREDPPYAPGRPRPAARRGSSLLPAALLPLSAAGPLPKFPSGAPAFHPPQGPSSSVRASSWDRRTRHPLPPTLLLLEELPRDSGLCAPPTPAGFQVLSPPVSSRPSPPEPKVLFSQQPAASHTPASPPARSAASLRSGPTSQRGSLCGLTSPAFFPAPAAPRRP